MSEARPKTGSLASQVWSCLESFDSLILILGNQSRKFADQIQAEEIQDELGRFRIWSGNIGAHRTGRSSLDYRLRDASHIRQRVANLLKDLKEYTQEILTIVREQKIPWDCLSSDSESDSDCSDVDKQFNAVQVTKAIEARDQTELKQLQSGIVEVISLLLRLSMIIRNPSKHDQFLKPIDIDTSYYEDYDIKHVGEKFGGKADEQLVIRLGKAISKRRHYLKYRETHHKKLAYGLEHADDSYTELAHQSTIASSLPEAIKQMDSLDLTEDTGSESSLSESSTASSTNETNKLRPPSLPKEAQNGKEIECPLCFMILSVSGERSWKHHVFRDLHPFVCIVKDCTTPGKLFDHVDTWVEHEQTHIRFWQCQECREICSSRSSFESHLQSRHRDIFSQSKFNALINMHEVKYHPNHIVECLLCRKTLTFIRYSRHMGKHLKELALFALPANLKAISDEDDDELDEEEALHGDGDELREDYHSLSYLDQLAKFHKQHSVNLNRFHTVDKRPLDFYKLKRAVETRGEFDKVCELKKWPEIAGDLGYSGAIMLSLSTSLKNSYQKWLQPYEEYLKIAKAGVQHQSESDFDNNSRQQQRNNKVPSSDHCGIEAAGLVLGSIPIIVTGLKCYLDGVKTIKRYFKYKEELKSLLRNLQTEYDIFKNNVEVILDSLIKASKLTLLLQDPMGPAWKDPTVEKNLKRRLQAAYDGYLETVLNMVNAVDEFQERLKLKNGKVQFSDLSGFRQEYKRLKFSLSRSAYEDLMRRIRQCNQTLSNLTQQSLRLEEPRARRYRHGLDFKVLRDCARSMYDTISTSLSCYCRDSHTVSLRLESRIEDDASDLEQCLVVTEPRFRVLFFYSHDTPSTSATPWSWEEADIRLLHNDNTTEDSVGSVVNALEKGKSVRFREEARVAVAQVLHDQPSLEPIKDLCKEIQTLHKADQEHCWVFLWTSTPGRSMVSLLFPMLKIYSLARTNFQPSP